MTTGPVIFFFRKELNALSELRTSFPALPFCDCVLQSSHTLHMHERMSVQDGSMMESKNQCSFRVFYPVLYIVINQRGNTPEDVTPHPSSNMSPRGFVQASFNAGHLPIQKTSSHDLSICSCNEICGHSLGLHYEL